MSAEALKDLATEDAGGSTSVAELSRRDGLQDMELGICVGSDSLL